MSIEERAPDNLKAAIGQLKNTLWQAAVLVLIGLMLAGFAWLRYDDRVEVHRSNTDELSAARTQLNQLQASRRDAEDALAGFMTLEQAGVIGGFDKPREADRFEQIASGHPAGVQRFSLGAFEPLTAPPGTALQGLTLGRHQLTFDAQPRHETHLLDLLDRLRASLDGLALLSSCELTRPEVNLIESLANQSDDGSVALSSNLRAQCAIDWYMFAAPTEATALQAFDESAGGQW